MTMAIIGELSDQVFQVTFLSPRDSRGFRRGKRSVFTVTDSVASMLEWGRDMCVRWHQVNTAWCSLFSGTFCAGHTYLSEHGTQLGGRNIVSVGRRHALDRSGTAAVGISVSTNLDGEVGSAQRDKNGEV